MLKKYHILLFLFLMMSSALFATHNRAGEITYRHIGGNLFEVTITTCTKSSVLADRPWLQINWGDMPSGAELDSIRRDTIIFLPEIDSQINIYTTTHTYPGPGNYWLTVEDQNRNGGVLNIPGSVNVPFFIQTLLVIHPQAGFNNSVQLLNPAKAEACIQQPWYYNNGAYDPDGDELVYSLVECRGLNGDPIPGYEFPEEVSGANDIFNIDSETGDITWDSPQIAGEYNIAVLIEEYRDGILMGSVVRDMQLNVSVCNNEPPVVEVPADTCINVGDNLSFTISASDPDNDPITLSAIGAPLTEVVNTGSFNPNNGFFSWTPGCEEIRNAPYQMLFKAEDSGNQVPLTGIASMNIRVAAPAVENPIATADGNTIALEWDPNPCIDAFSSDEQEDISYKIYRKLNGSGFEPDHCELGVPEYTGYQLIGTVEEADNTSFIDDGVFFGGNYCYMVVTCFPDGAESYASEEFCAEIIKDIPVMTNVSVNNTDNENGEIYVAWSPPTEIDTISFAAPYEYRLYWGTTFEGADELIYSSGPNDVYFNGDTTFVHGGIDTQSTAHVYRVELYSEGELVESSSEASSVFINLVPNDNQLTIEVSDLTPWINSSYEFYRYNDDSDEFEFIAETNEPFYTDTNLNNNQEYCYVVRTIGSYGVPFVIDPIENWSQERCAIPIDLTPPCPPQITVDADCDAEATYLSWTNPNLICPETDDVMEYALYYKPFLDSEFQLLETFDSANQTDFVFSLENTIAGCFAVTALDSLMPGPDGELTQNESEFSNIVCADNCPAYFLPNIFTPNNDGANDLFVPFPYRYVESVNCIIYNRWGNPVFKTTNPDINWNGVNQDTGEMCTDGTYYYVVKVNTIRLEGIVTVDVTGTVTIKGASDSNKNVNQ
ncbi:T9SS type B sorting domain-containing protein [Halocola ammonii]